jgi:L-malate glycosyltransferase
MKILLFTELYKKGGVDTFLVNLINSWPNQNDNFLLISNKHHNKSLLLEKLINPDRFSFVELSFFTLNETNSMRRPWSKKSNPLALINKVILVIIYLFGIWKIFLVNNANILMVVNGGHPGGLTCRIAAFIWNVFFPWRIPCIYNFHNIAEPISNIRQCIRSVFGSLLLFRVANFIGVSQACSSSILPYVGAFQKKRVLTVFNGIADVKIANLDKKKIRENLLISQKNVFCLMVASYEERKGHKFLLQLFEKLISDYNAVTLIFFGDGSIEEINRINKLIRLMNLVDYVKVMPYDSNVIDVIAAADILLIASQEYESFGLTAIEAMSQGVPVLSTNIGGLPEVILDGEGGYCFDASDPMGYLNKWKELVLSQKIRCEQGQKGRLRYLNNFSASTMSKMYANIIESQINYKL